MTDYETLLTFVELNDYQNKPFHEVIELYDKEIKDYYESMRADDYLSSIEAHEIINF